jgi:glycosyltransferase involved in cell wall biosynthesis
MTRIEFEHGETAGLVSIVIPTRRGAPYIGQTLASIERQTYAPWEVIIVEDGSDDGTQAIVEDFRRRCPSNDVRFFRNDRNYGASYSRNVAFAKSRGEYIALVDNDDRWLPDHLAHSVAALRNSAVDIVYSTVLMIEDGTETLLGLWGPDPHETVEFPHGMFRRNFVTPSATVMRRQVLVDVGAWDTDLRYCEDAGFWMRCIVAEKKFLHLGGCSCLYRKNHAGATTQKMCGTLEEFATIVERYLDIPGLHRRDCIRSVSKAYARAAQCHAQSDVAQDASTDRRRAAPLMWKAWRMRPSRIKFGLLAAWYYISLGAARPPQAQIAAAQAAASVQKSTKRAA